MAGILLHLDDGEVQRALAAMASAVSNLRPVMRDIGEIALSQTQQSFEDQASPSGEPWEPSQRALEESGQTLADSGQLLDSLAMELLPGAVLVGSNKVYAAIHQLGGRAGRGHSIEIPAREYLPDEDSFDWREAARAIDAHLSEGLT